MNHSEFIAALARQIGGDVLTDEYSLGMYATDASIYQIRPIAIVLPRNREEVKTAVALAGQYGISILPRGAGTSLAGQTVGHSMILDFSKYLNRIIEINAEERWVRVEPGMARDDLNAVLAPYGLHFAPDPATSSRANVGGMVGNNSSGTKSIVYGKTVDHVLEAEVLLADGTQMRLRAHSEADYDRIASGTGREAEIYRGFREIIQANEQEIRDRYPKVMRRVGGYNLDEFVDRDAWNLCKLITGSEGTLALSLELKLNLEPLPRHKSVCVVHYAELLEAIESVNTILEFGPAAVEILDDTVVRLSRENLTTARSCHFIEGDPAAILIVEFYGDTAEEVAAVPPRMIEKLLDEGFGYAYPWFPEGPDYEDVWTIRKKGLGLMLGLKGEKKPLPFIEDAGIPTEVLTEYIDRVLKVCAANGTEVAMYAHASVGVIHVRPILDLRQAVDIERLKKIAEETFELVMEYGGSWSGEHGDGLVRSAFNERFFGTQVYEAFRQVKLLFDPEWRMNPGKIIDAQTIEHNLRYGASYRAEAPATQFHYRKDESFGASVDMCTGVGECRKMLGGTMCPSFKATRDEEHSTRGRANALRMAMSGQLGEEGLTSDRLHQALDLCLSCKACKSECPSNVDMAKLKSEVLQLRYDAKGTTLRDRLIRDSSKAARQFAGWKAPLVNALQKTWLFRAILQRMGHFDARRTLPDYTAEPFVNWFAKNRPTPPTGKKQVVLFADTYLNYHEPQIGVAAVNLLESYGYEVLLADVGCCQRPRISHGFLKEAKQAGTRTAKGLDAYLRQGLTVVVCEPSCASALTDDLPDLLNDADLCGRLEKQVKMIDVFLWEEERKEGNKERRREGMNGGSVAKPEVLIHGHCHQKALYRTQSMKELLAGSATVSEIPSGCCGMAGSFGYEKEHYALSEKIGREILFPAVEKADSDAQIVACGFSCRHQIKHFTGKKARHWVEVMAERQLPG